MREFSFLAVTKETRQRNSNLSPGKQQWREFSFLAVTKETKQRDSNLSPGKQQLREFSFLAVTKETRQRNSNLSPGKQQWRVFPFLAVTKKTRQRNFNHLPRKMAAAWAAPFCEEDPKKSNKNIPQGKSLRDIFYESSFGSFLARKEWSPVQLNITTSSLGFSPGSTARAVSTGPVASGVCPW